MLTRVIISVGAYYSCKVAAFSMGESHDVNITSFYFPGEQCVSEKGQGFAHPTTVSQANAIFLISLHPH